MDTKGTDLSKLRVSSDTAINEVMALRAKLQQKTREITSLRADREELLMQFTNLQNAVQPLPLGPAERRSTASDKELVRLLCGDIHGSAMDREAVDAFLRDIGTWAPDEIVIGGDLLECGGFLAEHHTLGYVAETAYTYQDDIAAANWFLDEVQKAAPTARLIFVEGNHDRRVEKWIIDKTLRNQRDSEFLTALLSPRKLLRMDERGIEFYGCGDNHVPGLPNGWIKLGKCFITHELGGGKHAASSSVTRTAGNIVFFHTHRADSATLTFPNVGLATAWNPGCLCLKQRMWNHSDWTGWNHGYGVQIVEPDGNFLHLNIPIVSGHSLVGSMHGRLRS